MDQGWLDVASSTRGLCWWWKPSPGHQTLHTQIHLFNIATTGNATDFGDLTQARFQVFNGTVSDSHGGLS